MTADPRAYWSATYAEGNLPDPPIEPPADDEPAANGVHPMTPKDGATYRLDGIRYRVTLVTADHVLTSWRDAAGAERQTRWSFSYFVARAAADETDAPW